MSRSRRSLVSRLALLSGAVAIACLSLAAAPAHSKSKTISLFNGRDLSNFYTWLVDYRYTDPDKVFTVDQVDGAPAIRVSGRHYGGFVTKNEYSNYRLVTEYSWGSATWGNRKKATKDCGILVHAEGQDGNTGKDFNGPWMRSQECQIIEGGVGDFILVGGYTASGEFIVPKLTATASKDRDGETIYDPKAPPKEFQGGRINWWGRDPDWVDVLGFRGKQDVETPGNGWTRVEVICDGDNITNIVNGHVVNKGTKSSLTKGKLIFQSEGAEIYFRKIDLIPLR